MLETLITSKTRLKLLMRFFLNSESSSHLRNLATEFGESTNSIRVELNRLSKAGLLQSKLSGNKKIFSANTGHPLFPDIKNILLKHVGFDRIINHIVKKLGNTRKVYVAGDFAKGIDEEIIQLVLVGETDELYLQSLISNVEEHISKKISYSILSENEFGEFQPQQAEDDLLLLWENEKA